jgi:glycogen(starch) synthase
MEEIPPFHAKSKEKIRDFVMSNFFPYYYFDLDNTLFYYISGRYEVHAKGVDVFIKSLGKLNERLKNENSGRYVVALLFIPADVRDEDFKIVESEIVLKNIKERIRDYSKEINKNILNAALSGKYNGSILSEDFLKEMKKMVKVFSKEGNPPLTTHVLAHPENDEILRLVREEGLTNKKEDHVKIVYYPAYLNSNDGLLNMGYYEVIAGCHLGIFPSFYEPWGYTPVESAAYGVPSITTDMSGFGKYTQKELKTKSEDGKGA